MTKTLKIEKQECVHYWLIDSPDGPTSMGKCLYCGEKRRFINAFSKALEGIGEGNGKVRQPIL